MLNKVSETNSVLLSAQSQMVSVIVLTAGATLVTFLLICGFIVLCISSRTVPEMLILGGECRGGS